MFIAGLVKMRPAPKTATAAPLEKTRSRRAKAVTARQALQLTGETNYYDFLIYSVFRPAEQTGKVVAFTAASAGAGTSFVVDGVGDELSVYEDKKTLIVDAKKLQTATKTELENWLRQRTTTDTNLFRLRADKENIKTVKALAPRSKNHKKTLTKRAELVSPEGNLKLLRTHFDYILVDCQPVKASSEMMTLAKLVDGVIIVTAAGDTRRDEIERSQQVVEMAEGQILGLVLNKRDYPVPDWLYNKI
jgi:Mrp family chromosome partitioning ATPase